MNKRKRSIDNDEVTLAKQVESVIVNRKELITINCKETFITNQEAAAIVDQEATININHEAAVSATPIVENEATPIVNHKENVIADKNTTEELPKKTFLKCPRPQAAKPLSAIAARKAAAAAAATSASSKPELETDHSSNQMDHPTDKSSPPRSSSNNSSNTSTPNKTANGSSSNPTIGIKTFKRREPRFFFKDPNLLSTFKPTETNVQSITVDEAPCLIIGIKKGEKIVFGGKALIAPLSGSVSIMGSILQSSSSDVLDLYPAYSPKTHSLLAIQSSNNEMTVQRKSKLQMPINNTMRSIVEKMKQQDKLVENIFLVMGMQWCGLDDIEDLAEVPRGIFQLRIPKTTDKEEGHDTSIMTSIPGFQPLFTVVPDIKALNIPPAWENYVEKARKTEQERRTSMVGMICGNKDMGKSTFARYLTNTFLNRHKRVAYLETDVGQCEFTPSGMVSLHIIDAPVMGPPYTHQHLSPTHSHYIGSLTSNINPGHYLDAVCHLIHVYKTEYNTIMGDKNDVSDLVPLIINTQGWINGLGYDLLLSIIQQATPTDVFVMYSQQLDASKNLPPSFAATICRSDDQQESPSSSTPSPQLHYLECVVDPLTPTSKFFSATSSRELAMLSYLHQDLHANGCQIGQPWWDFQTRIVDKLPWVLDWRKGLVDGVWFLTEDVPQSEMLYALNGTLVALVGNVTNDDGQQNHQELLKVSDGQLVPPLYFGPSQNPPPTPSKTKCYGLAIIRAIDPTHHAFHMVTPLPLSTLKKASCILKGNIALPVSTLLDQHNGNGNGIARQSWNKVPYLEKCGNVNGIGATVTKKRRIHIRKRHK